jgi:hypothetical protein
MSDEPAGWGGYPFGLVHGLEENLVFIFFLRAGSTSLVWLIRF